MMGLEPQGPPQGRNLFAQQDVTSVPDPTQPNPAMGEVENTLLNILQGVDPSFGLLTQMAGLSPERPDVTTQLTAGLLVPGVPGAAGRGLSKASIDDLVKGLKKNPKAVVQQQDQMVRIEKAINEGSTAEVKRLQDAAVDGMMDAKDQTSQLSSKLVATRTRAELTARALLGGDEEAIRLLTEGIPEGTEDAAQLLGINPFPRQMTPAELAGRLNRDLSEAQLLKLVLGIGQ